MKPKLSRILSSDYIALLSLIAPIVIALIYLLIMTGIIGYIPLRKFQNVADDPEAATVFLWMLLGSLLVFMPLFGYRVADIFERFEHARPVDGQIVDVIRFRDRGKIVFTFAYGGMEYTVNNAVHFSKTAKALRPGQIVMIAVPPENPRKALLTELYCEDKPSINQERGA